jgi:hypothetical protein
VTQTATHYAVEVRVGSHNPLGAYTLRTKLAPYATQDGVEFCEIWLDRDFGVTTIEPLSDDDRPSAYVEVQGPLERFLEGRSFLFNVRHYRDSEPSESTAVTASLAYANNDPVVVPLPIARPLR